MAEDCDIDQVLQTGLKIAVQKRVAQYPLVFCAADGKVILQDHLILGDGPRFIGAEHVHRAEVLHRA
ncbi:hypothetical protein SDC9_47628 [bioreactor metagenome]|uniref:Uncharacterized protein n=1 Tax=bioreactor metagenome TaxID=1076179 RepID=A0A644WD05_9ZZZZ